MKTFMQKKEDVNRKWYVVDASGKSLGRVAAEAAKLLRGKHKPTYTPNLDTGDHVIILNASKVVLTGKKLDQKIYRNHSGYIGGLKETTARELLNKSPEQMMMRAVKGMLPKGRLGRQMYKKLFVYAVKAAVAAHKGGHFFYTFQRKRGLRKRPHSY